MDGLSRPLCGAHTDAGDDKLTLHTWSTVSGSYTSCDRVCVSARSRGLHGRGNVDSLLRPLGGARQRADNTERMRHSWPTFSKSYRPAVNVLELAQFGGFEGRRESTACRGRSAARTHTRTTEKEHDTPGR